MHCIQCNNELAECTCPDLQERLDSLKGSDFVHISKENMEIYEKQAQRNKAEQSRAE